MNQPLDQDYKFLIGEYAPLGLALKLFKFSKAWGSRYIFYSLIILKRAPIFSVDCK